MPKRRPLLISISLPSTGGPTVALIVAYGAGYLSAELAIAYVSTVTGAVLHAFILAIVVLHAIILDARFRPEREAEMDLRSFLLFLPLANLARLATLGLPLGSLPVAVRPGVVALTLGVAVISTLRASGLSRQDLGFWLISVRAEALMAASGLPLSLVGFAIASPLPLHPSGGSVPVVVLALLVGCVGAAEEMIFRGLLLSASVKVLGWLGVPFIAVFSSAPLLSERSVSLVVYAFMLSLYFGTWVLRRRCIIGVVIAHGLTAAGMFVFWPYLL